MTGLAATWRLALRIARRDTARSRARSLLIALLIGLPVLAAVTVDVVYRSDQLEPRDQVAVTLGRYAQARLEGLNPGIPLFQAPDALNHVPGLNIGTPPPAVPVAQARELLAAGVPSADRLVRDLTWTPRHWPRAGDLAVPVGLRELDYADPGLAGLYTQLRGRAPIAAGEIAVPDGTARAYGLDVGSTLAMPAGAITPDSPARTLTVVGVVRPAVYGRDQLIGRPGDLVPTALSAANARAATWYVIGREPIGWDQVQKLNALGVLVTSRTVLLDPPPPDQVPYYAHQGRLGGEYSRWTPDLIGITVVAIGLVLLQVGLMAGPALAVGARRNARNLALIAAAGGHRTQLRAVVLANALFAGLIGTVAAGLLGAAIGSGAVAWLHGRGLTNAPRVDIHLADLAALVAVGVATALAAALLPARQASRADVVAALNGARGQAPPQLRVPVTGLVVAVAGAGLAVWSAAVHSPFRVVLGIAIGEIGLITAVGSAVAVAARLARRLPVAVRVALRDAARQRSRTAPAVAAVMAALAGATAVTLYVAAQDDVDRRNYHVQQAVGVVRVIPIGPGGLRSGDAEQVRRRLPELLPVSEPVPLRVPRDALAPATTGAAAPSVNVTPWARAGQRCPGELAAPPLPGAVGEGPLDDRCHPYRGRVLLPYQALVDDGTATPVLTGVRDPGAVAALRAGRVVVYSRQALQPDGTVQVTIERLSDGGGSLGRRTVSLPGYLSGAAVVPAEIVLPPSRLAELGLDSGVESMVAATTRMPSAAQEQRAIAAAQELVSNGELGLHLERGFVPQFQVVLLVLVAAAALVAL
ncbi:MAG TPA: FtsX-like permease family protein, partial [Kineosporiaceae bacterium]|nr:FtsX-like permease family protein [Kineosporiaceae bacterium]